MGSIGKKPAKWQTHAERVRLRASRHWTIPHWQSDPAFLRQGADRSTTPNPDRRASCCSGQVPLSIGASSQRDGHSCNLFSWLACPIYQTQSSQARPLESLPRLPGQSYGGRDSSSLAHHASSAPPAHRAALHRRNARAMACRRRDRQSPDSLAQKGNRQLPQRRFRVCEGLSRDTP